MNQAAATVAALREAKATVAIAESLTGGLLCSALVDVPGASEVFAGGVVAYGASAKIEVLAVSAELVDQHGVVSAPVAAAMAQSVRAKFGVTHALATTGVAGPGMSEEKAPGTVFVALAADGDVRVNALLLHDDRDGVRKQAVVEALSLLLARLEEENTPRDG